MSNQTGRSFAVGAILFLFAWVVLASPWLSGRVTIPYDAKAHFQAQIQFLANALHSGQSPAWSPNVFTGSPQIADPQSLIFSPAYLIAALSPQPSFQLVDGFVLGLLALGGIAVMALFRDRGWHSAGAVLAALVFAFGASASWRVQHIGQVQSYAMFAVALWALSRALDRGSILAGIMAGAAAAVMVVEPNQVALIGVYVLALLVGWHLFAEPRKFRDRMWRAMPPLAAGSMTGALIVLIPLVLTALFASSSSRASISFAEAARGSLHPASLLTGVIADLFGAFSQSVDYWGPYSESWNPNELTLAQNMSQIYCGVLPAVLIAVAGFGRGWLWRREIRPYVLMLGLVVLYALGAYTPAFRVFYDYLPGVAVFRRPADATFFVGALAGIVGGYLLHCWLTSEERPRFSTLSLLALALIFAIGIAISVTEDRWAVARLPIVLAGLWVAGGLLLLAFQPRLRTMGPFAATAFVAAFSMADLAVNNGPNESTALAPAPYDILKADSTNTTIRALKALTRQPPGSPRRDRIELAGLGFDWPNAAMVHGFDHLLGYNPLRLGVVTDVLGAGDTIAGPDQRHFTPLFPSYRSTLADLLGLRYILTPVPVETIDKRLAPADLRLIARTADAYIYENPQALPRVLLVHEAKRTEFGDLIRSGTWPSFDPTRTVLLEDIPQAGADEPQGHVPQPSSRKGRAAPYSVPGLATATLLQHLRLQATANISLRPGGGESVRLVRYENTRIEIEVAAQESGYIVLNDVWHPWWSATVNGKPTEILKANVMFRAVRVPAGPSRVMFSFEPVTGAARELLARVSKPKDHHHGAMIDSMDFE